MMFVRWSPKGNLAQGCELLASKIKLEPPSSIKRYLGCEHVTFSHTVSARLDCVCTGPKARRPRRLFRSSHLAQKSTSVPEGSTGSCEIRMIKYVWLDTLSCVGPNARRRGAGQISPDRSSIPMRNDQTSAVAAVPRVTRLTHPRLRVREFWVIVLQLF